MKGFTGSCLCRAITYNTNTAPLRTFNCHCEDCRKCSGAPYLTNIFVKEGDLYIQGTLKSYIHQSESGNKITKKFCEQCGCQMFSLNEGRPGLVRIHAGTALHFTELMMFAVPLPATVVIKKQCSSTLKKHFDKCNIADNRRGQRFAS